MSRIFICHRRADSGGHAGRLYDRLAERFGHDQVFMDVVGIEPGEDFAKVIEEKLGSCEVLLALIGKQWLTITDGAGNRRLDKPDDLVRLEIATALDRNIRVIPVLVDDAPMPKADDLPDALKKLAGRQAHKLSEQSFHYDVDQLIRVLEKELGENLRGKLPHVRDLYLDHPESTAWRESARRYLREFDRAFPNSDYLGRFDNIPWHPPNKPADDSEAQEAIYKRACDDVEELLKEALRELEEKNY